MTGLRVFAATLAAALLVANAGVAQVVRVQNGLNQWGYGWMFGFRGNCYVALPDHVAGPLPKIAIYTAAPVQSDQASVQKPFWPGMDLAVAVIDRGVLDRRCTASLDDLKPTNRSRGASLAQLHLIDDAGEEDRMAMQITARSYLTLAAEVTQEAGGIGQGKSGAFLFVGDVPVGMALEHDDPARADFLRTEEIAMHLGRYLAAQGFEFRAAAPPAPAPVTPAAGLAVRTVRANLGPVLPQHAPENLLGEGLFVVRPSGPLEITLRLDSDAATALGRLTLRAAAQGYAVPRDITVFTDGGAAGTRFRYWTEGQMTPDGRFDTGALAPRNVRWVRILIRSAWGAGDIALDRVTLE